MVYLKIAKKPYLHKNVIGKDDAEKRRPVATVPLNCLTNVHHVGIGPLVLRPEKGVQVALALIAKVGIDQAKFPQQTPLLHADVSTGEDDEEEHVHDNCRFVWKKC